MKKVTCENGHFYDADRFGVCPVCGRGSSGVLPGPASAFDSEETVSLPLSSRIDELAFTAWIPPEEPAPADAGASGPGWAGEPEPENVWEVIPPRMEEPAPVQAGEWAPAAPPERLRRETEATEPCPAALPVGWLVGLSGRNRGRPFPCRSGRNRIGRAPHMDIVIPNEPSMGSDVHAQIIYEPRKRKFFLQAGNGGGLSYLNDELVFTHEELRAYDRITLGDAEFIFVPLCGEAFDWNTNTHGE